MSRTVQIIIPLAPHAFPGQSIQLSARCAIREFGEFQLDMSFHHQRIDVLHLLCHWSERYRTGDIGGSILILRSGIYQNQTFRLENNIRFRRRLIVNNGAMCLITGYRIKGNITERCCSARSEVSLRSMEISVCPPASTAGLSHLRNLTIATPSLSIACRKPAISLSFSVLSSLEQVNFLQ